MQTHNKPTQTNLSIRARNALAATLWTLGVSVASAHPGHDWNALPATHLLTSPYHLVTFALVGAGLLLGARFVQRTAARHVMQWTGAVAIAVVVITAAGQLLG